MAIFAVIVGFVKFPVILDVAVPVAPPVIPPVTAGASHEYDITVGTIPSIPLTGVTVKPDPLHAETAIAVIAGVGLTVNVYVNTEPAHPLADGVIRYITSIGEEVVLINVSVIGSLVCPVTAELLIPATKARPQLYVVPVTALVIS